MADRDMYSLPIDDFLRRQGGNYDPETENLRFLLDGRYGYDNGRGARDESLEADLIILEKKVEDDAQANEMETHLGSIALGRE